MGLRPALNVCHAWLCHLLGVPVASAGPPREALNLGPGRGPDARPGEEGPSQIALQSQLLASVQHQEMLLIRGIQSSSPASPSPLHINLNYNPKVQTLCSPRWEQSPIYIEIFTDICKPRGKMAPLVKVKLQRRDLGKSKNGKEVKASARRLQPFGDLKPPIGGLQHQNGKILRSRASRSSKVEADMSGDLKARCRLRKPQTDTDHKEVVVHLEVLREVHPLAQDTLQAVVHRQEVGVAVDPVVPPGVEALDVGTEGTLLCLEVPRPGIKI
eukprot:bmy_11922T0